MAATYSQDIFSIAEFERLKSRDELVIQPKFQRRALWPPDAQSYLIDTIVRALPMPKIYLRRNIIDKSRPAIFEVVDGQQRLRSIFDFLDNKYELKQKHNEDFPNTRFDRMPEPVQRDFLSYRIAVEVMEDATDSEVWGMFERLNRNTFTVNAQERRNAKFSGLFKQLSYQLAAEPSALDTWKRMGVFGDQQIARMREVEMTSDVLAAMVEGITDISMLNKVYKDYDDEFPTRVEIAEVFREIMNMINFELIDAVRRSKFKLQARTYSLMVSLADAMWGIPRGLGPMQPQTGSVICERMIQVDEALKPIEVPLGLAELKRSLSSATSHVAQRRIRNNHFVKMLALPTSDWEVHWYDLLHKDERDEE